VEGVSWFLTFAAHAVWVSVMTAQHLREKKEAPLVQGKAGYISNNTPEIKERGTYWNVRCAGGGREGSRKKGKLQTWTNNFVTKPSPKNRTHVRPALAQKCGKSVVVGGGHQKFAHSAKKPRAGARAAGRGMDTCGDRRGSPPSGWGNASSLTKDRADAQLRSKSGRKKET